MRGGAEYGGGIKRFEGGEHVRGEVGAEVDEHGGIAGEVRGGEEEARANKGIEAAAAEDAVEGGTRKGVVDLVWRG